MPRTVRLNGWLIISLWERIGFLNSVLLLQREPYSDWSLGMVERSLNDSYDYSYVGFYLRFCLNYLPKANAMLPTGQVLHLCPWQRKLMTLNTNYLRIHFVGSWAAWSFLQWSDWNQKSDQTNEQRREILRLSFLRQNSTCCGPGPAFYTKLICHGYVLTLMSVFE